jgi:hypothetical protein
MAGGMGGVPPQNQKRGRVAHISQPRHGWDPKRRQTLSQRGRGMGGPGGRSPHGGGYGGVPPQNQKRGRVAHISQPRHGWDPKLWQTLSRRGRGMGGPGGRSPHGGGLWGVSPHKTKRGGELPTLANPATGGTQNSGEPSANGGGQNFSSRLKSPSSVSGRPTLEPQRAQSFIQFLCGLV